MRQDSLQKLVGYILPEELHQYFDIQKIEEKEQELHIYLEEQLVIPTQYLGDDLISKGFHDEVEIKDFPIRDKGVLYHVRRRRWLNRSTGAVVSRDWQLVAKGTHYTQGFASFLKEFNGYISNI